LTRNYWHTKTNKVKFFNNFAKSKGFDPLVAENWYRVARVEIKKTKKAAYIMEGGSVVKTLMDVYPNIGLKERRFRKKSNRFWHSAENRRNVFIEYAGKHGFDPLVAENWYTIKKDDIGHEKGGIPVIHYHSDSVINALLDLFPDIGLQRTKFLSVTKNYWHKENRKTFFGNFAKRMGFDPLVADNWYNVKQEMVNDKQGAGYVLKFCYGMNLDNALRDVYGESLFRNQTRTT